MPTYFLNIFYIFFCALSTYFACLFFVRNPFILEDKPNERSAHKSSVPRSGGVAIAIPLLLVFIFLFKNYKLGFLFATCIGGALFFLLGFFDDCYKLSARYRFAISFFIASIISFFALDNKLIIFDFELNGFYVHFIQILVIVFCINVFNFMDGLDLMASSEVVYFLIVMAVCLIFDIITLSTYTNIKNTYSTDILLYKNILTFFLCFLTCIIIFAYWNKTPAFIFLGDSGSYFIGFIFAMFTLLPSEIDNIFYKTHHLKFTRYFNSGTFILIWLTFSLDVINTLFWRLIKRKNIFQSHREHIYQMFHRIGWHPFKIIRFYMILNFAMLAPLFFWIIFRSSNLTLLYILWQVVLLSWYFYKSRKIFNKNVDKLEELILKRDKLVELQTLYKLKSNKSSNYHN